MASAPSILEIALVLLGAAGAGLLARRVGLPAVLGYLAVGLLVSPFTPGYVAERHQFAPIFSGKSSATYTIQNQQTSELVPDPVTGEPKPLLSDELAETLS